MRLIPFFLFNIFCFGLLAPWSLQAQETQYKWEQVYYGMLNGENSLLFSHEMRMSKLAFADIDGDGDDDIFLGQENGAIAFFENQGDSQVPDFVLITQEYKAVIEQRRKNQKVKKWAKIDVGRRSAPALVDIDDDGDLDLFIGSEEGKIWFFRNRGNNLLPVFQLETSRYEGLKPGKNSTPFFADINLQRKSDLLVGTVDGRVLLYVNQGTRRKANFRSMKPIQVVEFGLETHAVPSLMDWDKDGDLDLLVGQKNGTISLFTNQGDRFSPDWQFTEQSFQLIDIGGESAPFFVDLNGDNELDLIIGSANPTVFHYENKIQNEKRILWNRSTNLFNFNKLIVTGRRGSLAIADLDDDGDLDLLVGEDAGNINHFENQGTRKNPNWVLKTEELIFMTGVQNSVPTLGDLDNDGDLDLLIGSKQGNIAFVENKGTASQPRWVLADKTYFQIDVGSNSVPRLRDVDQDGDLDLFIGNFTGRVILFLNQGSKEKPQFVIESTRYASAKVQRNAVPAFFDWNQDKKEDLILGSSSGGLGVMIAPDAPEDEDAREPNWIIDEKALAGFQVGTLSHPLFEDFDGDQNQDLLLGNYLGDFLLFLNRGLIPIDQGTIPTANNSLENNQINVEQEETGFADDILDEGLDSRELDESELEGGRFNNNDEFERPVNIDPKFVRVVKPLISKGTMRWSRPTMGDLDQDGDLDLMVGTKSGHIYLYENQGNDREWNFQLVNSNFLKTDRLENTSPLLFDLDQDGDLDLIVGSKQGRLRYYENQGSTEQYNFVYDESAFQNFWLGTNARPAAIDLNNDGILDLLIGTIWGKLIYLHNASNRFEVVRRDYQNIDVGINSTPGFFDLNNSGSVEMLVGSDAGQIFFFRNEKKDFMGQWQRIPNYEANLSFPRGSSPAAYDLDSDGDLDLISGSEQGPIILYRNDAVVRQVEVEEETAEAESEAEIFDNLEDDL
ncbi:MAG: hypothetical protein COB67_02840 [SAR324 cluster bacterium]|uniref:VCBS repeat-containing protein n=1 Tax=SAR324 cluster bacterium TaxID=2024889 RepID=A0A2A4TA69_9DELT|nr:MAG: hypothetical protein COB67_02840 [SAR324 cluster bacterium]